MTLLIHGRPFDPSPMLVSPSRAVAGMGRSRTHAVQLGCCLVLLGGGLHAQETTNAPLATPLEPAERSWAFTASVYGYLVPDSRDYLQPTVTADRHWLHLEARYNYENLETGSAWLGYNFSIGQKLTFDITPMLGGVFGETTGIAPGYRGSLNWWWLTLYSEGEYVYVPGARADSFFYNWSELTLSPFDWLRIGGVTQRTRAYQSELEVQRGFLVGFSFNQWELTAHVFNPDRRQPTYVLSVGVEF